MSAGLQPNTELEIAHVLFIDVVEYSRLLINEQSALLAELNQVVRTTPHFCTAEAAGKLIRIPVGDGMALVFFTSPEAPVQCALEICKALQEHPHIHLRMGIHSGPVDPVTDVNDRSNVAGAGMNIAQRIMDCADAGHILLSKRVAEDLAQYGHWKSRLHDLGEIEVKHGTVVSVFNLYGEGFRVAVKPEPVGDAVPSGQSLCLFYRSRSALRLGRISEIPLVEWAEQRSFHSKASRCCRSITSATINKTRISPTASRTTF